MNVPNMLSHNKKNTNNFFITFFIAFSRACSGSWHWSIAGVNTSIMAGVEDSDRNRLQMENRSQEMVFYAVIFPYLFPLRPELQTGF